MENKSIPSIGSTDFELKWKTKVSTSIKHICYRLDREQKKNIVFGGYDRKIRIVADFEWGDKQPLDIPQQIEVQMIEPTEKEKIIDEITKIQEVPTNIREHIFEILLKKEYLKDLATELKNLGYTQDEILEELTVLKTQKSVVYEKVVYPVWSLPEEEREGKIEEKAPVEEPKVVLKHMVIEEPIKTDKEKLSAVLSSAKKEKVPKEKVPKEKAPKEKVSSAVLSSAKKEKAPKEKVSAEDSLSNVIIEHLKQKEIVATKAEFVNSIKEKGFATNQIEKEINILKEQGKIKYSRAKPKGWSLAD